MMVLWAGATYLARFEKKPLSSLIAAIPATFMTAVSVTYILIADEGFKLSSQISYPIGIAAAVVLAGIFLFKALLPVMKENKTLEK